ncbi:hypothetical protein HPB47_004339, partial [Ixodes persulcatus]
DCPNSIAEVGAPQTPLSKRALLLGLGILAVIVLLSGAWGSVITLLFVGTGSCSQSETAPVPTSRTTESSASRTTGSALSAAKITSSSQAGTGRSTITTKATTTTLSPVNPEAKVFSRGRLYYRASFLNMDTDTLYVGAMEYLFALNMTDINNTDFKTLDCRNHISVIRPIRSGATLYVCGTGARDPTDRQIDATDLTDVPGNECVPIGGGCNTPGNARARCPPDFYDNGTAIWVGPQFLGSFDVGDYVYLFFHEVAEERRACGYEMMATVARVCKADTGSVVQRREWATYLKTRLNCSVHSTRRMHSKETPYRFHEI